MIGGADAVAHQDSRAETMLIVSAALFIAFVDLFYRQPHEAGQEGYNASESVLKEGDSGDAKQQRYRSTLH